MEGKKSKVKQNSGIYGYGRKTTSSTTQNHSNRCISGTNGNGSKNNKMDQSQSSVEESLQDMPEIPSD